MSKNTRYTLVFLFSLLLFFTAKAQTDTTKKPVRIDSLIKTSGVVQNQAAVDSVRRLHSPKKATFRSLVLPGWGQAYNKKYWKIPIIYGALGITGGIFLYNLKSYREIRFAYSAKYKAALPKRDSLNPGPGPFRDSSDYGNIKANLVPLDINSLRFYRDDTRKNIDYSVLVFLLFWGLNVVDATVDGHLKAFDVSPDLSLSSNLVPASLQELPALASCFFLNKPVGSNKFPASYLPLTKRSQTANNSGSLPTAFLSSGNSIQPVSYIRGIMKIALLGYGKMGQMIEGIAAERGHQIILKINIDNASDFTREAVSEADAAIEFTGPDSAFENIKACIDFGVPVVSGSTGWNDKLDEIKEYCLQKGETFLHSSNFSIGVNIFFQVNKLLAKLMASQPSYDVALKEVHHTQKKDAPSGTAVTLAEQVLVHIERKKTWVNHSSQNNIELPIISERTDPAPGTHYVKYSSRIDDIEIIHTAHNREGFAIGAVLAAEFIADKKGVYSMDDVLHL